jgi:surface antigen
MKKILMMLVAVSALSLSACDPNTGQFNMNKQTVGTGIGALAGGVVGSSMGKGSGQLWATGAGAVLGGLLGSSIGASLDKADQGYATQAAYQANNAPIGQSIAWNNPQSGNHGTITPVRDGRDTGGRYCREYQQTVTVGGKKQSAYGTACQTPNGDWEVVN